MKGLYARLHHFLSNTYGVDVCGCRVVCYNYPTPDGVDEKDGFNLMRYNYPTPDGVDANDNSLLLHEPRSGSTIVTAMTSQCFYNRVAVGQLSK